MKLLLITACVFSYCVVTFCQWSMPPPDGWHEIIERCRSSTNLTDEEITDIVSFRIVPPTREGNCFAACIGKSVGSIKDDNTFNLTALIGNILPLKDTDNNSFERLSAVFENCTENIVATDPCDVAQEFAECVIPKQVEGDVDI